MKRMIYAALLSTTVSMVAIAHDEGHGPKVLDAPKKGGIVKAVVLKSEAKKGGGAELKFKSELARSSDGTARLYLYTREMSPIDVKEFGPKATGILFPMVKGKFKAQTFTLEPNKGAYLGKLPKVPSGQPFGIDVTLNKSDQELLTAFENLD